MTESSRPLPVVPHNEPEPVSLACAATACTYNDEEHCHAEKVEVVASDRGPICGTFQSGSDDGRMLA